MKEEELAKKVDLVREITRMAIATAPKLGKAESVGFDYAIVEVLKLIVK